MLDQPARAAVIKPLTPARYKMQITVGADTVGKLRRVQDLLRHGVPDGDPAVIIDRALTMLLRHLERTKMSVVSRPRASARTTSRSRYIPSSVRRAVWARDEGRCAFVGPEGRCAERGVLEFHHVVPYATGGAVTVDLISLRCRAHNQYEADEFGLRRPFVARERAAAVYGYELGPDRVAESASPRNLPILCASVPRCGHLPSHSTCIERFRSSRQTLNDGNRRLGSCCKSSQYVATLVATYSGAA
jgi:5-methylcytosine-specific restriction endonuclease McrA